MKKIRNKVFETNSSSTHSISIAEASSEDLMDTLVIDKLGNINIEGMEFGWEQREYSDSATKASYAMIYAIDWAGERTEEFKQILKNVIKKQTGCKEVIFPSKEKKDDWDFYPYGYIDHQSVEGGNLHYLFEDVELLRQFIFNKSSILTTDNDNH